MAAEVQVLSYHGAGAVGSNVRNQTIAFKRADNDDADLSNPVPIPDAGIVYSWRKYFKLNVVSGLLGQIGNIRWFADPPPDDWAKSVMSFVRTISGYTNPASVGSTDETTQVSGTSDIDGNPPTDATHPLVVSSAPNTITGTGTGSADYVLQQFGVLDTATSGMKTGRRFILRYDEV